MAHIATVAAITGTGTVYAVNALGVQRIVKAGDVLEKGETLKTVGNATVELLMDDGNLLAVAPDKTVHLDDNVSQSDTLPTAADSAISSSATSETIIQALERGTDLSTTLDATAAGLDGGGGGGNSFVQLLRISEGVDAQSYNFNFSGLGVLPITEGVGVVATASTTVANVTASLSVNPIAGDGVINATEAQSPMTTVSGTVGGDVKVGDTVTILVNNHTTTTTVTADENGKFVFHADVATSDLSADSTVDVSVKTSNADQTATATATAKAVVAFDTVAEAAISIDPVGNDIITAAQAVAGGNVMVTGTVGGDAKVNDVVTITVNGHETTGLVTQGPNGLVFSVPVAVADLVADKTIDASVKATDAYGNTVTTTAHHTVTGQSVASNEATVVTEDQAPVAGQLTATGAVTVVSSSGLSNAVDPTSTTLVTHTVTANGVTQNTPALGTLNVHADGTYDFNVSNSAVQFLGQGEKIVQTYEVKSADGTATSTITVMINGTNDAPVAVVATDSSTEGGALVTGQLVATDADDSTTLSFSAVGTVPAGLTLNADGSYSFDPSNAAYNHLAAGATQEVVLSFKANDGNADSATQTLTITVTGTNDAPVAQVATNTATEGGSLVNGQLTGTDADDSTTLSFSAVGAVPAGLTLNADGSYSFDPSNVAYNHLAAGVTQEVVLSFKANDGIADSAVQTLTITVTGTNDAPVAVVATDSATEGGAVVNGQLTGTDADDATTLSFSAVGTVPAGLTLNADGSYSFDPSNAAYNHLAAGATQEVVLSFKANDGVTDSAIQTLKITVTGTNDTPVAVVATNSATEGGAVVNGQLTGTDADDGTTLSFSAV